MGLFQNHPVLVSRKLEFGRGGSDLGDVGARLGFSLGMLAPTTDGRALSLAYT